MRYVLMLVDSSVERERQNVIRVVKPDDKNTSCRKQFSFLIFIREVEFRDAITVLGLAVFQGGIHIYFEDCVLRTKTLVS